MKTKLTLSLTNSRRKGSLGQFTIASYKVLKYSVNFYCPTIFNFNIFLPVQRTSPDILSLRRPRSFLSPDFSDWQGLKN